VVRDVGTDHVELIVLAGVGFWIGVGLLIARIGGWAALAAAYSHSGEFQGERLRFQLRFPRAPSIPLRVSEQLARWLADRAATSWPGRS